MRQLPADDRAAHRSTRRCGSSRTASGAIVSVERLAVRRQAAARRAARLRRCCRTSRASSPACRPTIAELRRELLVGTMLVVVPVHLLVSIVGVVPRSPGARSSRWNSSSTRSRRSPTAAACTAACRRTSSNDELSRLGDHAQRDDRAARDVVRRAAPLHRRREPRAQDAAHRAARRRRARDASATRRAAERMHGARGSAAGDDAHGGSRRQPAHARARRRRTLRPASRAGRRSSRSCATSTRPR